LRPEANQNVLITGAHGFLGRHLAHACANAGGAVVGLGHGAWQKADAEKWGLRAWVEGDVDLATLLKLGIQPGVIYHCAGGSSVGAAAANAGTDAARTVGTTAALIEFARSLPSPPRIVYPSSASVYGNAKTLPTPETESALPISTYGRHKLEAENLLRRAALDHGIPVAVVRMFSVYGPGLRKQLLWDACGKATRGESLFFGTGDESRDWLHVADAAQVFRLAAQHAGSPATTVNGGSGRAVSTRAVLEKLFAALGRSDVPRFSGERNSGDPVHYCADVSFLRSWGFAPAHDLDAGICEYAAWYQKVAP
jgi:UDP-glucose 4-epimerase